MAPIARLWRQRATPNSDRSALLSRLSFDQQRHDRRRTRAATLSPGALGEFAGDLEEECELSNTPTQASKTAAGSSLRPADIASAGAVPTAVRKIAGTTATHSMPSPIG